MSPEPPSDARAQALAAVLRPILRRARPPAPQPGPAPCPRPGGGGLAPPTGATGRTGRQPQQEYAEAAAWRGAVSILPAVLTLGELRGAIAPWDGLIHRRCSQRLLVVAGDQPHPEATRTARGSGSPHEHHRTARPGTARAPQDAAAPSPDAPAPTPGAPAPTSGGPAVAVVRRSGWELIRTRSTVQILGSTWLVRHELARRLGAADPAADTVAAPGRPPQEEPQRRVLQLRVCRDDVEAWALRSGDRNALHLRSGAAAQAGLDVGRQSVIAHGLLLGALSLALTPGWAISGPQRRGSPHGPGARGRGAVPRDEALSGLLPETAGASQMSAGESEGAVPDYMLRFPAPLEIPLEGSAPLLMDLGGSCENSDGCPVLVRG